MKAAMVGLACLGMVIPPVPAAAAVEAGSEVKPQFVDVALGEAGQLAGRLVNDQGRGLAGRTVSIRFANKEVAQTVTAKDGSFRVKNLRPGQHMVVAGGKAALTRFWTERTAPDSARSSLMLIHGKPAVRAQLGGVNMFDLAVLALLGVGAGFAIDNNSKIDDLEDQVKSLETSLASP